MSDGPLSTDMNEYLGEVIDFAFSEQETESSLVILYHGVRIYINISMEHLRQSPSTVSQYEQYLDIANHPTDIGNLTIEDFFAWILRGCAPQLTKLFTPIPSSIPSTASLDSYIHAETHRFILCASQCDELTLVRVEDGHRRPKFGVRIPKDICSSWPSLKPSEVMICANSHQEALSGVPGKVTAGELGPMFFKLYRFCDSKQAKRELEAYRKISRAALGDLRISQLRGLVQEEDGRLLGLLLSYIDAEPLVHVNEPDTSELTRSGWIDQITSAMRRLHDAGVVWGDVKPENVLVNASHDAWIVDFGGGYTDGWVDAELAGTKEGDLQGLRRIIEFLHGSPDAAGE